MRRYIILLWFGTMFVWFMIASLYKDLIDVYFYFFCAFWVLFLFREYKKDLHRQAKDERKEVEREESIEEGFIENEDINEEFGKEGMDYTKINTWEIFIEHFGRISKDHEENIQNTPNRIKCINCLLINEPKYKVQSGKQDFITLAEFDPTPAEEYLSLMPEYHNRYKEIMIHYFEYNNDLVIEKKNHLQIEMYWDIEQTEHFKSVDADERERLLRFHDQRGFEIQEYLITCLKKEGS